MSYVTSSEAERFLSVFLERSREVSICLMSPRAKSRFYPSYVTSSEVERSYIRLYVTSSEVERSLSVFKLFKYFLLFTIAFYLKTAYLSIRLFLYLLNAISYSPSVGLLSCLSLATLSALVSAVSVTELPSVGLFSSVGSSSSSWCGTYRECNNF